jgi:hypothetical protein
LASSAWKGPSTDIASNVIPYMRVCLHVESGLCGVKFTSQIIKSASHRLQKPNYSDFSWCHI